MESNSEELRTATVQDLLSETGIVYFKSLKN